jgi:hypothetical protein
MTLMKSYFTGLAIAALLVTGLTLPGYAEDTAAPAATAAPQSEAPPASVPRPSIVPKTAAPASAPAASKTAEPDATSTADEQPQRTARRHHRRYGYYRTAYWEPFPIYWPHLYRHRIQWNRIPWAFRF